MINLPIAVAALAARGPHGSGLPICWWGPPGVAKTAMVEALARALAHHLEAMATSLYEAADFVGIPVIVGEGQDRVVKFVPGAWARNAASSESALVFLDEATTASPSTQRGFLRVLNEREAGDLKLGEHVRFMLAANPPSMGGYDLLPQVANRMGHIDVKIGPESARQWAQWRRGKKTDLLDGVTVLTYKEVSERWEDEFERASNSIADYIDAHTDALQEDPSKIGDRAGRAWCSMRTWDYATSALASARIHGLGTEDTHTFCAAFVGDIAWTDFSLWLEEREAGVIPDPATFLDGGCQGWEHDPSRIDRTVALLETCVGIVVPEGAYRRDSRTQALWKWMDQIADTAAKDLLVVPLGHLTNAGLAQGNDAVAAVCMKLLAIINPQ